MAFRRIVAALLLFFLPFSAHALKLEEEKKYGREVYLQVASQARISHDPYVAMYMDIIKARLEAHAGLPFPIKLTVVESPSVEAFATVGGYVFVTTGLIEMSDREDEVAGVLGHEFGHVSKRHIAKRIEKEKFLSVGTFATLLLGALIPGAQGKAAVLTSGMGAMQTMSLKYSREDEEEADRTGLATTEAAGYSGKGIADFLKKIRAMGQEKAIPQYLLTHPYSEDRAIKIENALRRSRTTVDTSLFPFVVARIKILGRPLSNDLQEIWLNKYAKDSKDPVSAYGAALVYSLKGDVSDAVRVVSALDSPHRSLFLGEILVQSNRFGEAVEVLSSRTDPIGRYLLAKAYEGQSSFGQASAVLKELIPYVETFPDVYQRLAMVRGRLGDEAGGFAYLGKYHYQMGREAAARTYLERAIAKYGPNAPESQELLSLLDRMKRK